MQAIKAQGEGLTSVRTTPPSAAPSTALRSRIDEEPGTAPSIHPI